MTDDNPFVMPQPRSVKVNIPPELLPSPKHERHHSAPADIHKRIAIANKALIAQGALNNPVSKKFLFSFVGSHTSFLFGTIREINSTILVVDDGAVLVSTSSLLYTI